MSNLISSPPDVVFHIIEKELGIVANVDGPKLDESREWHTQPHQWELAFSVTKAINSKKLIEEISAETRMFPFFNNNGKLSFSTIHEYYMSQDMDWVIPEYDIIKYKATKTPIKDIRTEVFVEYAWDHKDEVQKSSTADSEDVFDTAAELFNWAPEGHEPYSNSFFRLEAEQSETYRSKYIQDKVTAESLQAFLLGWYCNQHTILKLTMPLKYLKIEVGDIVGIKDIIRGQKIFGEDYSVNAFVNGEWVYRNGQLIYPFWMVIARTISSKNVEVELIQMHMMAPYNPDPGSPGGEDFWPPGWEGASGALGCSWLADSHGGHGPNRIHHVRQPYNQDSVFPRSGASLIGADSMAENLMIGFDATVDMPAGTNSYNPGYTYNMGELEKWWFEWDTLTIENAGHGDDCIPWWRDLVYSLPMPLHYSSGWGQAHNGWHLTHPHASAEEALQNYWNMIPGFESPEWEENHPVFIHIRLRVSNVMNAPDTDEDQDIVTYTCCYKVRITPQKEAGVSHCGTTPCWSDPDRRIGLHESSWVHGSGPIIIQRVPGLPSMRHECFAWGGAPTCKLYTKWVVKAVASSDDGGFSFDWKWPDEYSMATREECNTIWIDLMDISRLYRDEYCGMFVNDEEVDCKDGWYMHVTTWADEDHLIHRMYDYITPNAMIIEGNFQSISPDPNYDAVPMDKFGCPDVKPQCKTIWCRDHDKGWATPSSAWGGFDMFPWNNIDEWYNPHNYLDESGYNPWNQHAGTHFWNWSEVWSDQKGSEYFAFNHPGFQSGQPETLTTQAWEELRFNYSDLPRTVTSVWEMEMVLGCRQQWWRDEDEDGEVTPADPGTNHGWTVGGEHKIYSEELDTRVAGWTQMTGSAANGGFLLEYMILSSWCWIDCGGHAWQFCVDNPHAEPMGIERWGGTCNDPGLAHIQRIKNRKTRKRMGSDL